MKKGDCKLRNRVEFGAKQLVIIALSTAVYSILMWFSAAFQVIPGASLIYPATAAAIVFSMWFGLWGALGAYFGTIIGGLAWGTTVIVSLVGGLHDMIEGIIPALIFYLLSKKLKKDLSDWKSFFVYLVFGCIINTLFNAFVGNMNYVLWGYNSMDYALTIGLWPWWLADAVAAIVLGIPLLRFMTPFIMKTSLYHQGFLVRRYHNDDED